MKVFSSLQIIKHKLFGNATNSATIYLSIWVNLTNDNLNLAKNVEKKLFVCDTDKIKIGLCN